MLSVNTSLNEQLEKITAYMVVSVPPGFVCSFELL